MLHKIWVALLVLLPIVAGAFLFRRRGMASTYLPGQIHSILFWALPVAGYVALMYMFSTKIFLLCVFLTWLGLIIWPWGVYMDQTQEKNFWRLSLRGLFVTLPLGAFMVWYGYSGFAVFAASGVMFAVAERIGEKLPNVTQVSWLHQGREWGEVLEGAFIGLGLSLSVLAQHFHLWY